MTEPEGHDAAPPGNALARLGAALGDAARKGPPPVERWNPPYCGEIDMRIDADGAWSYMGSPIERAALVRLFASVLRKDPERFVLVTPVERVGIQVEDAPFMAVEMAVEGEGRDRTVAFRTNVDDLVNVDAAHPLRFETEAGGGVKPYVRVRGDLWAKVTRSVAYDLLDLAEERQAEDGIATGIFVAREFYPVPSEPAE